jgi:hypothetical protein
MNDLKYRGTLTIVVLALGVLGICAGWVKGRARMRMAILVLAGILALVWWWFKAGWDKWNILTSIATLLAVVGALFYDEIQKLIYRVDVVVHVGDDLIDPIDVQWIRGRITNIGDRAVEHCRLRLLKVEGQNVLQPSRVENGFLQWQGGVREPMKLSPKEYWIFDIGTRSWNQNSPLRLLAYFGPNLVTSDLPQEATH